MSTSITDDNNRPQCFAQSSTHASFVIGHPACSLPDYSTSHPIPAVARPGTTYPSAVDGTARVNSTPLSNSLSPEARRKQAGQKLLSFFLMWIILIAVGLAESILNTDHNPRIHIDSALVSPFNVSNSSISAKWDIGIFLRNPNRIARITYDDFQVSVFYMTEYLSKTIVSPFHQRPKSQTLLNVTTEVLSQHVMNNTIASFIHLDIAHGLIGFDVKLCATIRYGANFFSTEKIHFLDASCGGVEIGFSANATNGKMLGGPRPCIAEVSSYVKD